MLAILKIVVAGFSLLGLSAVAWFFVGMWVKARWPARIPADLLFERDLASDLKLRTIAEQLAERFKEFNNDKVVCLGPVRGTAARVLFHAGPKNRGRNKNIHRWDYVLHVERLGKARVRLRLDTNKPYTHYRISRTEVEALSGALNKAYGGLSTL